MSNDALFKGEVHWFRESDDSKVPLEPYDLAGRKAISYLLQFLDFTNQDYKFLRQRFVQPDGAVLEVTVYDNIPPVIRVDTSLVEDLEDEEFEGGYPEAEVEPCAPFDADYSKDGLDESTKDFLEWLADQGGGCINPECAGLSDAADLNLKVRDENWKCKYNSETPYSVDDGIITKYRHIWRNLGGQFFCPEGFAGSNVTMVYSQQCQHVIIDGTTDGWDILAVYPFECLWDETYTDPVTGEVKTRTKVAYYKIVAKAKIKRKFFNLSNAYSIRDLTWFAWSTITGGCADGTDPLAYPNYYHIENKTWDEFDVNQCHTAIDISLQGDNGNIHLFSAEAKSYSSMRTISTQHNWAHPDIPKSMEIYADWVLPGCTSTGVTPTAPCDPATTENCSTSKFPTNTQDVDMGSITLITTCCNGKISTISYQPQKFALNPENNFECNTYNMSKEKTTTRTSTQPTDTVEQDSPASDEENPSTVQDPDNTSDAPASEQTAPDDEVFEDTVKTEDDIFGPTSTVPSGNPDDYKMDVPPEISDGALDESEIDELTSTSAASKECSGNPFADDPDGQDLEEEDAKDILDDMVEKKWEEVSGIMQEFVDCQNLDCAKIQAIINKVVRVVFIKDSTNVNVEVKESSL